MIDAAIAEEVSFVIIAGDLYDGDWQDWRTGLFFVEQVSRLAAAGIPLIMVAGNHVRHRSLPAICGYQNTSPCFRTIEADGCCSRNMALPSTGKALPPERSLRI